MRPIFSFALLLLISSVANTYGGERLNFLLITVDDMNCDSIGVMGCKVPGISPNIDKLAEEGMLFHRAHVTIAVCQPTRAVWMTGLYPHKNGARGFERINKGTLTLPEALQRAGYYLGILGKVPHVVPSRGSVWNYAVRANMMQKGRSPDLYYQKAKQFFDEAKKSGNPFFLMANSHDPHRPFAGSAQEKGRKRKGKKKSNRGYPPVKNPYQPNQVTVPKFLPDIPQVRLEMAEYFTSVRRADAIVGAVLRALRDSGMEGNTIVMFLSDHGMALPFAKTNCYYHSTRTPWIVRWPGVVRPGSADREHFVSGIDLTPTIVDALKLNGPQKVDGRSFVPLLKGGKHPGRDKLFTVFHKTSARREYEMRAAHDPQFIYIYNAWSDGNTVFRNESQNGRTMRAMQKAASSNKKIADRVKLFLYRVPQELYNYQKDPDCLHNLANDKRFQPVLERMQKQMVSHMEEYADPLVSTFRKQIVNR